MLVASRQPTFVELYTPKICTVLQRALPARRFPRRHCRRSDGCDRGAAAVDGDCDRVRGFAGARALHLHRRRISGVRIRRQPLSDRRPGRRLHRAGRRDRRAARRRRTRPGDSAVGPDPARGRLAAARHLRQIHPLSGHGRVHRRHRRHHLLGRARRPVRTDAERQGAWTGRAQARGARRCRRRPSTCRPSRSQPYRSARSSPFGAGGRTGRLI